MDEARRILERLERIETLRASGGRPADLLAELRGLVADGGRWVTAEGDARAARAALDRLDERLATPVPSPGTPPGEEVVATRPA